MSLFKRKTDLEEIKLSYVKKESGEVYVLLDDIVEILENRILTSNIGLAELIDQLKQTRP